MARRPAPDMIPLRSVLRSSCVAAALVASTPALCAQTSLTYDKPAAPDATSGVAAGTQRNPRSDSNGSHTFVVWSDDRTSVDASFRQSGDDVYGVMLDAQGQPVGAAPIRVADGAGEQRRPQVAWNGNSWLVVWNEQQPVGFGYEWRLHARRVATDGTLLDAVAFELPMKSSGELYFDVERLGGDWVVMTEGANDGASGIEVLRVASNGTLIDAAPIELVSQSVFLFLDANVEVAGNRLLLVYGTISGLVGQLHDFQLQPVGAPLSIPTVFAASSGTNFYFVWHDGTNMRGTPMDTNGVLQQPNGIVIASGAQVTGAPGFASIAWDGAAWWLGWQHVLDGIEVQRVRPNGLPLGTPIKVDPANADFHDVPAVCARPGGGAQLVWSDIVGLPVPSWDVFGLTVTSQGVPSAATVLSNSAPSHARTELAAGPNGTLLATCVAHTSNLYSLLAWRLDAFGNALEAPIVLDTGNQLGAGGAAWNGSVWLVTWTSGNEVRVRRHDSALAPIDPAPIVVMSGVEPDVEALGTDFLVAAGRFGTLPMTIGISGVRIDGTSGAILDAAPIFLGLNYSRLPRVVALGGRWLVVWQRNFSFNDSQGQVEAAFVAANGATSGSFPVTTFTGGQPDVAVNGNEALVVWRQNSLANAQNSIRGRRIDAAGQFLGADFLVADAVGRQLDPAVAFDGVNYVVAFEDMREQLFELDERTGIHATRVTPAGTVVDPAGFRVWSIDEQVQDPAVVTSGIDVVVLGVRFDTTPGVAAWHSTARRIGHWQDVGAALPGALGGPVLDARGPFLFTSPLEFQLSNAVAGTFGWFVVGASELALPIFGGVLTPAPDLLLPLATDVTGHASLVRTVPFTPTPGSQLWLQAWLLDPTAPQGLAASNAVVSTAL